MGIFSRNKSKKDGEGKVGGMEDFMYLIRVYFQSVIAAKLGITNLAALPDLRIFKQTLHVSTVNNKLGLGEKKRCQKMIEELYEMPASFFTEIDTSIKRACRNASDVQNYLYMFQGFSQELLMVITSTMQWKLRIPSIFKKTLHSAIEQGINNIFTSEKWKDQGVRTSVYNIRAYQKKLGYSPAWITEYAYRIVTLAKKEPKPKDTDDKKDS